MDVPGEHDALRSDGSLICSAGGQTGDRSGRQPTVTVLQYCTAEIFWPRASGGGLYICLNASRPEEGL